MDISKIIDICSGEIIDAWVDTTSEEKNGILYIRIGIVTLQLDRNMTQALFLALNKANKKLNELNIELEEWDW